MGNIVRILFVISLAGASILMIFGIPIVMLWVICVLGGQEGRLRRLEEKVIATLMTGEKAVEIGIQKRLQALFHRREAIAFTDSRIIVLKRGLLGGFKMVDLQWKDLEDVQIEENVLSSAFGSNISVSYLSGTRGAEYQAKIIVPGIDSDVAQEMYAYGQAQEQAWEEKRRVRELEERRAMAGGITLQSAGHQIAGMSEAALFRAQQPSQSSAGGNPVLEELRKAKELLDGGVVTDAEFQEIKSKILSRIL